MKGGAFNFFKVNDFPQDDKQLKQDAEEQLKQWARVDDFIVTTETTSLNVHLRAPAIQYLFGSRKWLPALAAYLYLVHNLNDVDGDTLKFKNGDEPVSVSFPDTMKEMENNKKLQFLTWEETLSTVSMIDHLQIIESVSVQLTEPETNNVIMDFFRKYITEQKLSFYQWLLYFFDQEETWIKSKVNSFFQDVVSEDMAAYTKAALGEKDNIKIIQDTVLKLNSIVYQLFRKQMIQESNLNKKVEFQLFQDDNMPVSVLFKQTNTLAVFHLLCSMINEALQPFIPSTAHRDLLTVQYRDILRFIYGDSFPLLNTTKNDIVDFFHQKNVSWCARDLYDPGTVWTKDMEEQLETLKNAALVIEHAGTDLSFIWGCPRYGSINFVAPAPSRVPLLQKPGQPGVHEKGGHAKMVSAKKLKTFLDHNIFGKKGLECTLASKEPEKPNTDALFAQIKAKGQKPNTGALFAQIKAKGQKPNTDALFAQIKAKGQKLQAGALDTNVLADLFLEPWRARQNRDETALSMSKEEFQKYSKEQNVAWDQDMSPFFHMLQQLPPTYRNAQFFLHYAHLKLNTLQQTPRLKHLVKGILEQYQRHVASFCTEPQMNKPLVTIGHQIQYFKQITVEANKFKLYKSKGLEVNVLALGDPILPKNQAYFSYEWFKKTFWNRLVEAPNIVGAQVLLRQDEYRKSMKAKKWREEWDTICRTRCATKTKAIIGFMKRDHPEEVKDAILPMLGTEPPSESDVSTALVSLCQSFVTCIPPENLEPGTVKDNILKGDLHASVHEIHRKNPATVPPFVWDVVSYLIVPTKWSAEEEVNDVVHDTMQEETTKQPTLSDIDKYKKMQTMGIPKPAIRQKMTMAGEPEAAIDAFFDSKEEIIDFVELLDPWAKW